MREQAGITIQNRCKLFHRKYPEIRISSSRLLSVYKKHCIKRKRVRQAKLPPPNYSVGLYMNKTSLCRNQLSEVTHKGLPVVYADETLFTRQTYMLSEYSRKKEPLTANATDFYLPPVWAIAFVEATRGVVHTATYTNNMDA